jgi:RNA polymerase sigma-70 factor (ECF subfamily)
MTHPDPDNPPALAAPGRFATTHWSLILAAQDPAAPGAHEAMAELCRSYWYPLYAFIRRQGHDADEAQDLTQELFSRLLERDFLASINRDKGRFRSFLLAACKHFLANEHDRARARKRGGGRPILSLDLADAERRYTHELSHELTAEKLFERRWALTLLDRVLSRLGEEYTARGKGLLFEHLRVFLVGDGRTPAQMDVAAEMGLSPGAMRVAVHRLRQRYRELLREEIAGTLDDPARVDEEIAQLFAVLGG